MKPLKINKNQKEKLLEMCIKLFPEYDFTLDKHTICHVTLGLKTKDMYEQHIFWFEFCMTHLAKKLLLMDDFVKYQTTGNFMYIHPVDYLYKKYNEIRTISTFSN